MYSSLVRKSLVLLLSVSTLAVIGCGGGGGAPPAGVLEPGPKKNAGAEGASPTGKGAPAGKEAPAK